MDEFETAAWEVDKNINSNHENVIEWIRNSKTATCTFSQGKYITKIKKLKEKYPDQVEIRKENKDGSIVCHIPVTAVKVSIVAPKELSEEQKEVMKKRLKKIRESKKEDNHD